MASKHDRTVQEKRNTPAVKQLRIKSEELRIKGKALCLSTMPSIIFNLNF
jgi:hypothetical protein